MTPQTEDDKNEIIRLLSKWNCIPVFFSADVLDKFFSFYEGIIRPCFHNFADTSIYDSESKKLWQAYLKVNDTFANVAIDSMRS